MMRKTTANRRAEFDRLCELEPRLRELYEEAAAVQDDPEQPFFCANNVWFGRWREPGLKHRLIALVGWDVSPDKPAALRTQQAFNLAYEVVYDALPDCRNCTCA